ncbi:Ferrochelatase [Psidium guajava]|nr:Ferrochelatase [Psidium guajava]
MHEPLLRTWHLACERIGTGLLSLTLVPSLHNISPPPPPQSPPPIPKFCRQVERNGEKQDEMLHGAFPDAPPRPRRPGGGGEDVPVPEPWLPRVLRPQPQLRPRLPQRGLLRRPLPWLPTPLLLHQALLKRPMHAHATE